MFRFMLRFKKIRPLDENIRAGMGAALAIDVALAAVGILLEGSKSGDTPGWYWPVSIGFGIAATIALVGAPIFSVVEQRRTDRMSANRWPTHLNQDELLPR